MTFSAPPLRVRDIMTTDVVTLSPDLPLRDAVELLSVRRITGAPVVASGQIVGVLSASDVLDFEATTPGVPRPAAPRTFDITDGASLDGWREDPGAASAYFTELWDDGEADALERMRASETPEWDHLGEHTVEEAMSVGVCIVNAGAEVAAAADAMLAAHTHRALVLDGDALAGLVTATDILRAVAERQLQARRYVFN